MSVAATESIEVGCSVCGCTDAKPCMTTFGPCGWVGTDDDPEPLCTGCALRGAQLSAEQKRVLGIRLHALGAFVAIAANALYHTGDSGIIVPPSGLVAATQ